MSNYRDDFFDEDRPWSKLKNRILSSYMTPYLAKVNRRRQRIVLVDAFAGQGKSADGRPGSPLIMAGAAEKYARGKYKALFFNNEREHHDRLQGILEKQNWSSCSAILGDGIANLRHVIKSLSDETFFLYIDPFGLDCEFDVLRPLLERSKEYSTEVLINLHIPITHRLGSRNQLRERRGTDPRIQRYHEKLNRVYGGNYWANELFSNGDTKEREKRLIAKYRDVLSNTGYLAYTGACPIRESSESATKYFMVFASSHVDSMLLLNDVMCKGYNEYMNSQSVHSGLFDHLTWQDWRDPRDLTEIVVEYVKKYPATTRAELWKKIVPNHFMLYTSGEYKKAIKASVDSGRIICTTPIRKGSVRSTKRLNDNCVFEVSDM